MEIGLVLEKEGKNYKTREYDVSRYHIHTVTSKIQSIL